MSNQDNKEPGKGQPFSDDDLVRIGNLLEMSAHDPDQTQAGLSNKRTLATLGNVALANRWANMDNANQRKAEMVIAQLVEAAGLKMAHEPFRVNLFTKQF